MPASTVSDEVVSSTLGSFTVQLRGEGICPAHFRNGQVYLGDYQLTPLQQKELIDLFSKSYQKVRAKNYAWRFLSSCHHYFTGQLHELESMPSDENRVRYLFCHAERDESNKTAEALKAILPSFYRSLFSVTVCVEPRNLPIQKNQFSLSEFIYLKAFDVSKTYKKHLSWMEELFNSLWIFPSVQKVSYSFYDRMHLKYYLSFVDDCSARIIKRNIGLFANFNPGDDTIERETAESEWAKKLYFVFDYFRRCVSKSNNTVPEINIAFDELMKKINQDSVNIDSAKLKNGEFYNVVKMLRTKLPDIHSGWQKSIAEAGVVCVHRY